MPSFQGFCCEDHLQRHDLNHIFFFSCKCSGYEILISLNQQEPQQLHEYMLRFSNLFCCLPVTRHGLKHTASNTSQSNCFSFSLLSAHPFLLFSLFATQAEEWPWWLGRYSGDCRELRLAKVDVGFMSRYGGRTVTTPTLTHACCAELLMPNLVHRVSHETSSTNLNTFCSQSGIESEAQNFIADRSMQMNDQGTCADGDLQISNSGFNSLVRGLGLPTRLQSMRQCKSITQDMRNEDKFSSEWRDKHQISRFRLFQYNVLGHARVYDCRNIDGIDPGLDLPIK